MKNISIINMGPVWDHLIERVNNDVRTQLMLLVSNDIRNIVRHVDRWGNPVDHFEAAYEVAKQL